MMMLMYVSWIIGASCASLHIEGLSQAFSASSGSNGDYEVGGSQTRTRLLYHCLVTAVTFP